jgi:hypothetical protein
MSRERERKRKKAKILCFGLFFGKSNSFIGIQIQQNINFWEEGGGGVERCRVGSAPFFSGHEQN